MEELTLKGDKWLSIADPRFFRATDGKQSKKRTHVKLRRNGGYLQFAFECPDDDFVDANTYTEYNSELWRQEVFEVFISAGGDVPKRYLEIEVNPNQALFVAWINNPTGADFGVPEMAPFEKTGINYHAVKGEKSWKGELEIPLSFIGPETARTFRLNLYRIVLFKDPGSADWECSPENCEFLCWQPTMSGETPAFHRPARFGKLTLQP